MVVVAERKISAKVKAEAAARVSSFLNVILFHVVASVYEKVPLGMCYITAVLSACVSVQR